MRIDFEPDPWRMTLGPLSVRAVGFRIAASGTRRHPVQADLDDPPPPGRWADDDPAGARWHDATADAEGRRLEVGVAPAGDGIVAVSAELVGDPAGVEVVGATFEAHAEERFFGFGERSHALDQRGGTVEHWVGEGPYQLDEYEALRAVVPPWSMRQRRDATYFPVPWLLSTRGYGVLLDNTELSSFRLCVDDPSTWSVEAWSTRLAFRVFNGPTPADALRRFTEATGRQPFPAAPWFFGPWFQTGHLDHVPLEQERAYVRLLRDAGAPVSVAETHCRRLPCGAHVGHRDEERARAEFFHSQGLACLTYFNPWVSEEYEPVFGDATSGRLLQLTADGQPYTYVGYVGGRPDPRTMEGLVDFTAPGAEELYGRLLGEALEDGFDGWMEDFGEATPVDSRSGNGMTGEGMHNLYPTLYHAAAGRATAGVGRPVARFVRSGWTGTAPHAPIVWGGDPTTSWGFDGLASVVKNAVSMGLSGIAVWGSDIGGFFSFGDHGLTPELLVRWIQLGALTPVMRTKSAGIAIPDKPRPQIWEPEIVGHWRRWAGLHTRLSPYLLGAAAEYVETGTPIVRHLALEWPGDEIAGGCEDEYLFGPHLLAAPVLEPGATERTVYLPTGEWVDLWRCASPDTLEPTAPPRVLAGSDRVTLPAPLDEAPVLVRAGAVLPLLDPDVSTLTDYGERSGVLRLADRADRLDLLAFPCREGVTETRFDRDERLSSRVTEDRWELQIDGARERRYRLQAALGDGLTPASVELDGVPVADWAHDDATGRLDAVFATTTGTLTVDR